MRNKSYDRKLITLFWSMGSVYNENIIYSDLFDIGIKRNVKKPFLKLLT